MNTLSTDCSEAPRALVSQIALTAARVCRRSAVMPALCQEIASLIGPAAKRARTVGGMTRQFVARETFYGGYAGYFTDPDGHVWEIACKPRFPLSSDGLIP